MADILQEGFRKLMRYAQNLAEYNKAIEDGIIDENVFVIVLDEKVAKFKGQTFDWSPLDISSLATKAEVIEVEEVHAAALNDLNDRIGAIEENVSGSTVTKEEFESTVTTITESVEGKADTTYVNTELGKKADTTYVDEKFGSIDFSTLATKEEVQNLTNEIIDNEEVHAAALNDLEERKADKEYVEDALGNVDLSAKQDKIDDLDAIRSGAEKGATAIQNVKTINGESIEGEGDIIIKADVDTSALATKEELTNLQNEIITNEEVVAAAFNDVNERLNEIRENLAGEAVTKEEFNETIEGINSNLEAKADASTISGLQASVNGINESLSGYVTSEALSNEITNLTNEIIANEEVHAAALTDLDARINNIITRLNNAGL